MNEAELLLRKGYEAYGRGDVEGVMSVLSDDIVWHSPGRASVAGDYKGKEELVAYFAKKMEMTGGTFRERVHEVQGNDRWAVGIVTFLAERPGKTLEAKCIHIAEAEDGKLTEFSQMFEDLYAWDEFWS